MKSLLFNDLTFFGNGAFSETSHIKSDNSKAFGQLK